MLSYFTISFYFIEREKCFKSCELHSTNFKLYKVYMYLITMQTCLSSMKGSEEVSKSLPQCLLVVWVDLVAHRNRKDTASSNTPGMCCKNSLFTYM